MTHTDPNEHDLGRVFDAHVYDKTYFEGNNETSGYDDYLNCEGIVRDQFRMINEVMSPHVTNRSHLDLACAYGFAVDEMQKHVWDSSGMDVSEFAISKAKELFPYRFTVADALDDTFWTELAPVGLISGVEFFEHIPSEDASKLIANMATKGDWGCFVINARTYPDEDIHKNEADHGHLNFHSMSWWITEFAKHGELDFEAMLDLNVKFKEYNEEIHWHNRVIVVRFNHEA